MTSGCDGCHDVATSAPAVSRRRCLLWWLLRPCFLMRRAPGPGPLVVAVRAPCRVSLSRALGIPFWVVNFFEHPAQPECRADPEPSGAHKAGPARRELGRAGGRPARGV